METANSLPPPPINGKRRRTRRLAPAAPAELCQALAAFSAANTVGETLPSDIKFGSFTALNADRYVHYSFYARFEDLFRHRWVKYVRSALFTYQSQNKRLHGEENWTTRLEIVLDRQGHFQRALLHEGSGFKALDAAPVEAMQEVKQVPNPPAEMVQKDGTVRLMYEFDVQFVAQYAAGSD